MYPSVHIANPAPGKQEETIPHEHDERAPMDRWLASSHPGQVTARTDKHGRSPPRGHSWLTASA
ncbi:hypothetical protein MFU01_74060 [Myxococcus fulvus]|uniref:Uncharacterized protein n=1 Tax=Myxococcus fulvus TaxID=33 RepID=A0A511TDX2_MYXFU|nr:hypothetical protein MFU01_74060 [Myxococcus fulvus]